MKIRRTCRLLIEPPPSATGDIAFNLIIFFLICASVQPEKGIQLDVPNSEVVKDRQRPDNVEIVLTPVAATVDGDVVPIDKLRATIEAKLQGKTSDNDRVVVVKTKDPGNTTAQHMINVIAAIKQAKGVFTLQIEETQERFID